MKTLKELGTIILYVSKIKSSMGLDCYLFKNNLGLPEKSIVVESLSIPKVGTDKYDTFFAYVANQTKGIIKSLSNDWESVGDKRVKLIFNTTETSISLSLNVYSTGIKLLQPEQTIPFYQKDLDFFFDIALAIQN